MKKITLKRTAWESVKSEYTMFIDEEYVKNLSSAITKDWNNGKTINVTIEMVADVLDTRYLSDEEEVKLVDENGRENLLSDIIYSYINDEIWDYDYEEIDGEITDWEDHVLLEEE